MARATRSTRVVLPDVVKARVLEVPHRVLVSPFKRLALQGLEGIAPILVVALATEKPMLLIGTHGTAKSLLLPSASAALRLEFRHYNANLLNFDDLVWFRLPGKGGLLKAAATGQTAKVYRDVAPPLNYPKTLHASHAHSQTWAKVTDLLSQLDPAEPRVHLLVTKSSPQPLLFWRGASAQLIFTSEE